MSALYTSIIQGRTKSGTDRHLHQDLGTEGEDKERNANDAGTERGDPERNQGQNGPDRTGAGPKCKKVSGRISTPTGSQKLSIGPFESSRRDLAF